MTPSRVFVVGEESEEQLGQQLGLLFGHPVLAVGYQDTADVAGDLGSGEASSDGIDDTEYFNHPGVVITAGGNAYGSVQYPASSLDVIAVGGTTLKAASNTRGWTETAWADGNGACSGFEPKTAWQTSAYCAGRRASNDVAADADPNTGVSAYDS